MQESRSVFSDDNDQSQASYKWWKYDDSKKFVKKKNRSELGLSESENEVESCSEESYSDEESEKPKVKKKVNDNKPLIR